MNCMGIEEMIPLYVEGDLDADRARLVSAHVKSCERCRQLAGEYNASQEWLRTYTPPEFDSRFFDGLKRGVLTQIEERDSRPSFFQLIAARWRWDAALAAAALVIIGGLVFYANHRGPTYGGGGGELVKVPKQAVTPVAPQEKEQAALDTPNEEQLVSVPHPRRKRGSLKEAVEQAVAPIPSEWLIQPPAFSETGEPGETEAEHLVEQDQASDETMTRIEIQTSDPNIRIIWFAPKSIDSDSTKREGATSA